MQSNIRLEILLKWIFFIPSVPALIILDIIKEKRNNYILNKARNLRITDMMEVSINLKKEE